MPISLSGQLWAKRVVGTSQEAYDAVVLHAGSWDTAYTAYNATGLEDGQRAEVSTWRGATGPQRRAIALPASPTAAQGQLHMPRWWCGLWALATSNSWSRSRGPPKPEQEGLPALWWTATLPCPDCLPVPRPRCDFAPPKAPTAALIPDDLPRPRLRGIMQPNVSRLSHKSGSEAWSRHC